MPRFCCSSVMSTMLATASRSSSSFWSGSGRVVGIANRCMIREVMRTNRVIAWILAAMAVCASAGAGADTAAEAKAHWERGVTAYGLGRFAIAAQEYEAAYELKPQPSLLYNAAQAHRLAGHKAKALLLYQLCVRLY